MKRYRKKPVVIEAIRWEPAFTGKARQALDFVTVPTRLEAIAGSNLNALIIPTLEGDHRADPGDWIIKGIQGEFYPCKPGVFDATYEPVEDGYLSPDERIKTFGTLYGPDDGQEDLGAE